MKSGFFIYARCAEPSLSSLHTVFYIFFSSPFDTWHVPTATETYLTETDTVRFLRRIKTKMRFVRRQRNRRVRYTTYTAIVSRANKPYWVASLILEYDFVECKRIASGDDDRIDRRGESAPGHYVTIESFGNGVDDGEMREYPSDKGVTQIVRANDCRLLSGETDKGA